VSYPQERAPLSSAAQAYARKRYGVRWASIPSGFVQDCWRQGMGTRQIIDAWEQMQREKPVFLNPATPVIVEPNQDGYALKLPPRRDGEAVLDYLARVQGIAVSAALSYVAFKDPDLRVTQTAEGWSVLNVKTGLRLDVRTMQRAQPPAERR